LIDLYAALAGASRLHHAHGIGRVDGYDRAVALRDRMAGMTVK
jgi:hypothetical protein